MIQRLASHAFSSAVGIFVSLSMHAHYYECTPRVTKPVVVSSPNQCYGQQVPICGIGKKPTCICTGDIGQNCGYICM